MLLNKVDLNKLLELVGKPILLLGLLMELFKDRVVEHGRCKLCLSSLIGWSGSPEL